MVAWLAGHVDWFWLVVGLLVGWNLMKQPKWVADLLGWSWAKVTSFIPKAPK
jgi:hypothetical protein|tara:strand:+ start:2590 stop:2745 length:156 start_codon:yes stop_codon:yes gene_type:complete